jgi:hypothetical protein
MKIKPETLAELELWAQDVRAEMQKDPDHELHTVTDHSPVKLALYRLVQSAQAALFEREQWREEVCVSLCLHIAEAVLDAYADDEEAALNADGDGEMPDGFSALPRPDEVRH